MSMLSLLESVFVLSYQQRLSSGSFCY